MPQQSILSPWDSEQNSAGNHPIVQMLQQHESDLNKNNPSFLDGTTPNLPSPSGLFSDYIKTGEPLFKEAASNAYQAIKTAVTNPEKMFNNTVSYNRQDELDKLPEQIPNNLKNYVLTFSGKYNVPSSLVSQQLLKENQDFDPVAVNHNKNGTKDLGLMQINSSMVPYITNEFAKQGKKFDWKNPMDSIEAATILHNQNRNVLKNYGIPQTDKNMFDAYNVGPAAVKRSLQGDKAATSAIQSYDKGSMFGT